MSKSKSKTHYLAALFSCIVAACGGDPSSDSGASLQTQGGVTAAPTTDPTPQIATTTIPTAAPVAWTDDTGSSTPAPAPTPEPPRPATTSTNKMSVFFSGHSLMDNPMPDDAATIAASLGKQVNWNQQNFIGSPIRMRTRGWDMNDASFSGYRLGKNRDSSNMDVVSELRSPRTIGGGERYDVLILTERHDLPLTLQWEDTVRYARHFHDRLIEGNPNATTYLYHAWLDVRDKSNPQSWINYERSALPAWQCVASRINLALANEGRRDRVQYMPAGLALVQLVERATQGYVPGVTGGSVTETMNKIFRDNVHLNRLGTYFMSLVNHATVYRASPVGAWVPADIDAAAARSLQEIAWQSVSSHFANPAQPSMASCQATMRDSFCASYASYTNQPSVLASCVAHFTNPSQTPFHFDAGSDRSYWFSAPR